MSVIMGAANTLEERWDSLEEHQRTSLLGMISGQSDHVSGVLRALVLALPAGVLGALDPPASGCAARHQEHGSASTMATSSLSRPPQWWASRATSRSTASSSPPSPSV